MQYPYAGISIALILGSLGFPFPEDAILILCGCIISRQAMEPLPALAVTFAGLLAGDLIIFSLGKRFGRRVLTHRLLHRLITPEILSSLERRFARYGAWLLLAGRQLFGIRGQIFLAAGILRMPLSMFLPVDACAAAVTMSIMVTAGYTGGKVFLKGLTARQAPNILVALTAVVAVVLLVVKYRRKRIADPV